MQIHIYHALCSQGCSTNNFEIICSTYLFPPNLQNRITPKTLELVTSHLKKKKSIPPLCHVWHVECQWWVFINKAYSVKFSLWHSFILFKCTIYFLEYDIFLSDILRYKTKKFPTPFSVQYMGRRDQKIILSDGRKSLEVQLSNKYSYLFQYNLLSQYDIITINEIARISQFKLFIDNISIVKKLQINCKLGNPTPFCAHSW